MKKRRKMFRLLAVFLCLVLLGVPGFLLVANMRVLSLAKVHIYKDIKTIPHRRVAIVLGTSPRYGNGVNPYFAGRIRAAAELYKAGKVDRILVSGDNGTLQYNEPAAMESALVKQGVLAEHITKDYAGFRTLDTMARARLVFGLREATVVTDDFHMARALYFAQSAGIEANGFSSAELPAQWTKNLRFRETLARARAVLDVDILHTGPKYLGSPVEIR